MRDLRHHAPDRGRVFALDHLVQTGKTQTLDHQFVLHRRANRRAHILEMYFRGRGSGLGFGFSPDTRHDYSSSAALPRAVATSLRSRRRPRALKVALITLCGLVVPIDLVSTFCTPAEVITARTAPPAITPVPSGAGFSSTIPEPNRPSTACGMVVCSKFTRTRFFLADSIPLRIACGTSFALPEPNPTTAAEGSPTTTSAAKDRFLPPFTTLVTRLMATTWSFSWY